MKILLDENNYIIGYTVFGDMEGAVEAPLTPVDMEIPHIQTYQLLDGVLVKDVEKYEEAAISFMEPEEKWLIDQLKKEVEAAKADLARITMERQFKAVMTATQKLIRVDELTIEELASIIDLYPDWKTGVAYKIDDVVQYGDKIYKVLQAHTAQADWTPNIVPALFLNKMPDNIIPEWIQPTGGHDAYNIDDQVIFGGVVYKSLINANVWSPTAYPQGWILV